MDSQQTQFNTALQALTPQERQTYIAANPFAVKQSKPINSVPVDTSIGGNEIVGARKINVTQPRPSTGVDGLLGELEASSVQSAAQRQQEQAIQQADKELAVKSKSKEQSGIDYVNSLLNQQGQVELTDKALEETGFNQAESDLKQINNDILAEQNSLRRQIQEVEKNSGGMFAGGVNQEIERIKNISLAKQADLSIIQLAKQGRYDSAKAIADRKVAVQMEQNKNILEARRLTYEENKADFTKAEQRQFELKQNMLQRQLNIEEQTAKTLSDTRIDMIRSASEQGAPRSVLEAIQQANTAEKAIAAAGQYAGDILDRQFRLADIAFKQKQTMLLGEPTAKEKQDAEAALKEKEAAIPVMKDKIAAVGILSEHPGLDSRVGTNVAARRLFGAKDRYSGAGQDFAGGIHKLVGGMTLQSLIDAKSRGASFGALSDGELQILANSATALNDWEIKDETTGKPTGVWDIDEASFKRELATIKSLTERAILLSGGSLLDSDEAEALNSAFGPTNVNSSAASYY